MISTPHEYVALLERRGLFSPSAPIPEQNTTVWAAYFDLYQQHIGSLQDVSIVVTPEGLGFYHDPLVEDPLGSHVYAWALVGAICHPILPFSPATIIASADSILDTFSRCGIPRPAIITESFEMSAPPSPREENHFLWLNSPRAAFHADFQTYAASLSSSRRHHLRRLTERFSTAAGFTFDFSDDRPGSGEIDFMLTNLQRRWGAGDMGYALLQTLWPISVAAVMPERARFMRVRHQGVLSFLNSFILRDDVIIAQATCKNEDMSFDGLGIYIDFKTIELLSGRGPIRRLDPTCRTGAGAPETIEIAKRKVVNEDARKPVFLAGHDLPALEVTYPHFAPGRGWVVPEAPIVTGRPA